jgi:hypothetical protein
MEEEALKQPELIEEMAKAYELQETLKKERQQVRLHEEEYQKLMDLIISSKVLRLREYEVTEAIVQKKRQIISDKFRKKWPKLFNRLATVTMKAAREEGIGEHDLEAVCETKIVTKHVIMIRNGP